MDESYDMVLWGTRAGYGVLDGYTSLLNALVSRELFSWNGCSG